MTATSTLPYLLESSRKDSVRLTLIPDSKPPHYQEKLTPIVNHAENLRIEGMVKSNRISNTSKYGIVVFTPFGAQESI